jgi:LacI family transcriptional regulator
MEAVALKAGVSITTVSHVINKTRNVNQETKDAVLKVMQELNYQTSRPRPGRAKGGVCIGVILADAREDYYVSMLKAIQSVAADYDVSLLFCDSEASFEKEEKNIQLLVERHVNGLLLAPADADRVPKILKKISVPVVLIDRQYESHSFLFVGINNFQNGYLGTKSALEKGCDRIGFIGYSDPVYTIRQRIMGYKAALMEQDSSATPKVLYLKYNGGDPSPLIKRFIEEEACNALVCATSSLCGELIAVIDTLSEKIWQNLRIICFDDNRWLEYLRYPVTVISQPVAEIGNAALENLLQLVEQTNTSCDVKRELLFETTIIDR